jgi:hypothetical protein
VLGHGALTFSSAATTVHVCSRFDRCIVKVVFGPVNLYIKREEGRGSGRQRLFEATPDPIAVQEHTGNCARPLAAIPPSGVASTVTAFASDA